MRFALREEPWEHWDITDVIPTNKFSKVQKRVESWDKTPPDKRRISKFIVGDKERDGYIYDPWLYEILKERFIMLLNGIDHKYYTTIFEYNSCPAGYTYPIHVDAPEKIASLVIYISENGDGTSLYNDKHELIRKTEWKPNNGFLFYRHDDTHHSYESTVNHRDTINCILVKKDKDLLRNLRYEGHV